MRMLGRILSPATEKPVACFFPPVLQAVATAAALLLAALGGR